MRKLEGGLKGDRKRESERRWVGGSVRQRGVRERKIERASEVGCDGERECVRERMRGGMEGWREKE